MNILKALLFLCSFAMSGFVIVGDYLHAGYALGIMVIVMVVGVVAAADSSGYGNE
jgi:hypothetical protein